MKTKSKSKSPIVGLKELRENMEDYIAEVEKGRTFLVMRRSKPIFKLAPVDMWGDEGNWETIVDFKKINPKGVPAKEILAAFRSMKNEQNQKISSKTKPKTAKNR